MTLSGSYAARTRWHRSSKRFAYEGCDLAAEQFDCAHHEPVLHTHPLDARDESIAARSPHQISNLGSAFFRGTDYESICNKVFDSGWVFTSPTTPVNKPQSPKTL